MCQYTLSQHFYCEFNIINKPAHKNWGIMVMKV